MLERFRQQVHDVITQWESTVKNFISVHYIKKETVYIKKEQTRSLHLLLFAYKNKTMSVSKIVCYTDFFPVSNSVRGR